MNRRTMLKATAMALVSPMTFPAEAPAGETLSGLLELHRIADEANNVASDRYFEAYTDPRRPVSPCVHLKEIRTAITIGHSGKFEFRTEDALREAYDDVDKSIWFQETWWGRPMPQTPRMLASNEEYRQAAIALLREREAEYDDWAKSVGLPALEQAHDETENARCAIEQRISEYRPKSMDEVSVKARFFLGRYPQDKAYLFDAYAFIEQLTGVSAAHTS